ncbi:MAG TPA: DUF600 family protein [Gemmatales bacterium]|nr:DUF600 family protein [Gemmatales bacterium]
MIPGIEEYYQQLGAAVNSAIGVEWNEASLEAIFYPDSIDFEAEYVDGSGKLTNLAFPPEAVKAFRKLRQLFKDEGKPLWGSARFEINSKGKFNMKWVYDHCDENGNTIWDKEGWHLRQEERRRRFS